MWVCLCSPLSNPFKHSTLPTLHIHTAISLSSLRFPAHVLATSQRGTVPNHTGPTQIPRPKKKGGGKADIKKTCFEV